MVNYKNFRAQDFKINSTQTTQNQINDSIQ